jgi:hypothetical protein
MIIIAIIFRSLSSSLSVIVKVFVKVLALGVIKIAGVPLRDDDEEGVAVEEEVGGGLKAIGNNM